MYISSVPEQRFKVLRRFMAWNAAQRGRSVSVRYPCSAVRAGAVHGGAARGPGRRRAQPGAAGLPRVRAAPAARARARDRAARECAEKRYACPVLLETTSFFRLRRLT